MVAVGAYSKGGGLLTICSSMVGAYSRGLFGGGAIRGFTVMVPLRISLYWVVTAEVSLYEEVGVAVHLFSRSSCYFFSCICITIYVK